MKKIVHIAILVMLIVGTMQIILPFNETRTSATSPLPDDFVNGTNTQFLTGDWIVTSPESYTNESFVLTGNLTIQSGGSLTLKNVTLAINCSTENGTYDIQVMDGGSLIVTDYDNDPATTDDISNITDSPFDTDDYLDLDYRYSIKAWQGSYISFENSIIREAGFPFGTNDNGIYIYTDNVNIQNCTIERNWYGLYLRGSKPRLAYNEIRYCNEMALYNTWTPYFQFYNNHVHHNENGIFTQYSDYSNIYNNNIHNNSNAVSKSAAWDKKGLEIWRSDYSNIFNNSFVDNCGFTWSCNLLIYDSPYSKVYDNIIQHRGKYGGWSLELDNVANFEFYNNTITNNNCSTFYYDVGNPGNNVRIYNNNISNNAGTAMQIRGWGSQTSTFEFKNNKLYDNAGGLRLQELRTFDIQHNQIINCSSYGVYVNDVAGGEFSNNTINATTDCFVLRDSYGPNDDTIFEVVNCTSKPEKYDIIDGKPKLVIMNFLHVNVTDNNSLVPGASVTIRNNTNAVVFAGETDGNGSINFIKIKNQTIDKDGILYYDPHNISATLDVYTAYGNIEPTMNKSQAVNVHFGIDLPPLATHNLAAVGNGTNVDLTWEPSKSGDLTHYLIYRNGTGSNWILRYNSSNTTSKELWTNWTDIGGAATPSTFSYKVVAVDHLWQNSFDSNIAKCGNWYIEDARVINGLEVQLNGSMAILPTGELTLNDCQIQFNNSFQSEYGITVEPGGTLTILDIDNNPNTTDDRSIINTTDINFNTYLSVSNADLNIRNSQLSNFGFDERMVPVAWEINNGPDVLTMGEPKNRGIYIYNSQVTIESNIFSNNFVSVLMDSVSNGNVNNNDFASGSFGIYLSNSDNVTSNGNVFTDHDGFPIYILNSENSTVVSNTITNPSNTPAGISLYDAGCKDNEIFWNNISNGEHGIHLRSCGLNNNISYNSIDGADIGIHVESTLWTSLFDNTFDSISDTGCLIESSHYTCIIGGSADATDYGYYVDNSMNCVLAKVNIGNASANAITLVDPFNIRVVIISINYCSNGLEVDGGNFIHFRELTMENCNIGIYCTNYPSNIYLYNSNITKNINQAVKLLNCEDLIIINCTFDAQLYNFNLVPGGTSLINTTYNQTRVYLMPGSYISLYWFLDVQVMDWYGKPASSTNVQIREVLGTLVFNGKTDSNGYIRWLLLLQRNQYSTSNESATPYLIKATSGTHSGQTTTLLNLSTMEIVNIKNTGPMVSNIAITPTNPVTTSKLSLDYTYSDGEDDDENKTIIKWYSNGIHIPALNNLTDVDSIHTAKDQTWNCEIIPNDGATYGTPMISAPVRIFNTEPEVDNVAIHEAAPSSSQDLHINYTYTDIDNDLEVGSLHKWLVDRGSGAGWEYAGLDAEILSASYTKKGERWRCEVKPYDGDDYGLAVQSPPVTIGNTPPQASNLRLKPTEPMGNETIQAMYEYYDLDSDPEANSIIKWFKNDIEQAQFANTSSVPPTSTKKGDTWHFAIIPSDGEGAGKQVDSEKVVIGNTAPKVTNIIIHPLNPTTTNNLNVTYDFIDDDGDAESFETNVQWLRKREGDINFTYRGLRVSALSSIYTVKNELWTCEVTPHDGDMYGETIRAEVSVEIINSVPAVSDLFITPTKATTRDGLKANYEYMDKDEDIESGSKIVWYRDDNAVPELNDLLSVPNNYTKKSQKWHFTVQPSDGDGFGEIIQSSNIVIQNSAPTAKNVKIAPNAPTGKDSLRVAYDYFDEDGDTEGEPLISWFENGIQQPEFYDQLTIPSDAVRKGKNWHYTIRVFDGEDYSSEYISNHPEIGNSFVIAASISPSLATVKTVILNETEKQVFRITAQDIDGDFIKFEWRLDGILVSQDDSYVFQTDYLGDYDEGIYNLTLVFGDYDTDYKNLTTIQWEIIVNNVNRRPTINEEDIVPKAKVSTLMEHSSLTFSVTATDPDLDVLIYNWYFNDLPTGKTGSSYAYVGKATDIGDHKVKVVVTDGDLVDEYAWNITVEKKEEEVTEEFMGQSYDWWGFIGMFVSGLFAILMFLFGLFKMRQKKSRLKEYMEKIEEIMESDNKSKVKESELLNLRKEIKREFSKGLVTESHYIILEREVDTSLGEIRTAIIKGNIAMPKALKDDVAVVLEDGMVTKAEYRTIAEKISASSDLSEKEKRRLSRIMKRWMDETEAGLVEAEAEAEVETDETEADIVETEMDKEIDEIEKEDQ